MSIDFNVGEVVPGTHYRVVFRIGQGGMGSVYEVEHVELGKRFVLKALLPQFLERKDLVQRLRNEWRSLGKLEHANIVSVSDAGVAKNGVPFYVMERLQGETLAAALKTRGRLPIPEALRIACEILEGLSAAHEIGVVHRDVKPPNIFLTQGGVAKVLDFGIAKLTDGASLELTGRGIAIGTPRYMSPEQAAGEPVDGRADLYAVGLLLFEMIAGVGPFDSGDANEVFLAHLTRMPPRLASLAPEVPLELDGFTAALLAKHPSERPATAGAAARALRGIWRGYPQLRQDTFSSPMSGALTPVISQVPPELLRADPRIVRSGGAQATIFPPALGAASGSQPPLQYIDPRLGQRHLAGQRRTPAPLAGYPADMTTQGLAGALRSQPPPRSQPPSLSQLATFNDAPPTRTAVPVGGTPAPAPSGSVRPAAWGSVSIPAPPARTSRVRLVAVSALAIGVLCSSVFWLARRGNAVDGSTLVAASGSSPAEVMVAAQAPQVVAAVVQPPVQPLSVPLPAAVEEAAGAPARTDRSGSKVRGPHNSGTSTEPAARGLAPSAGASLDGALQPGAAQPPGVGANAVDMNPPERVSEPRAASRGVTRVVENGGRRLPGPGIPLYRRQPLGR